MKKNRLFSFCLVAMILFFCSEVLGQPDMMGRGYDHRTPGPTFQLPVKMEQAKNIVTNYLEMLDNPNYKQGKVEDKGDAFVAEILTQEGSLVDQIKIDKDTGRVYNRYGLSPGMSGRYDPESQSEWNYCPYCGRGFHHRGNYDMGGTGMHHGPRMMGPGMMGPGMMGPGYGYHQGYWQSQEPMNVNTAKDILNDYLKSLRNPNLKIGDIKEKDNFFEAEILTKKKEDLVDIISVNKYTGWIQSVY